MAQLSPSPPCKPPLPLQISHSFLQEVNQAGNWQPPPDSPNCTLNSHPLLLGILSFYTVFLLLSHNLNFHTQSALIQPQFLRMHPPDTSTVGCGKPTRDWLWKLRKSGKEEKETTQGRQRIVCLLSSPFCYLHQSTVSLGSFYLRDSLLGSPELLGVSLCQPTTKICDGFLKAEL